MRTALHIACLAGLTVCAGGQRAAANANARAGNTVFSDQIRETVQVKEAELRSSFAASLDERVEATTYRVCEFSGDAELRASIDRAYDRALSEQVKLEEDGGKDQKEPVFTTLQFNSWVHKALNPKDVPLDEFSEPALRRAASSLSTRNGFHSGAVVTLPRHYLHGPVMVKLLRNTAAECARSIRKAVEVRKAEEEAREAEELATGRKRTPSEAGPGQPGDPSLSDMGEYTDASELGLPAGWQPKGRQAKAPAAPVVPEPVEDAFVRMAREMAAMAALGDEF